MKGKIIFIVTFIAVIALPQIGQPFSYAQAKENINQSFKVKIPDGLYLFQDIIDPKYSSITPLMIIKDGQIIDPYKMGIKQIGGTFKENISGKTLGAFIGDEKAGRLKGIKYMVEDLGEPCPPRVEIKGEYEGFPQNYDPQKLLIYTHSNSPRVKNFNACKVVFTPAEYNPAKSLQMYPVSEYEKNKVIDTVKANSIKAITSLKKRLKNTILRIKPENKGKLKSLIAVDLDGNGRKDFIGIYVFYFDMKNKRTHIDSTSCEMIFVLCDSGQFDVLATNWEIEPAFSLGGILDIDDDGFFEIIFQEEFSPAKDYDDPVMRQIIMVRYGKSGWEEIYKTKKICGGIQ